MRPSELSHVLRRSPKDFRKIQEPVPLTMRGWGGGQAQRKSMEDITREPHFP